MAASSIRGGKQYGVVFDATGHKKIDLVGCDSDFADNDPIAGFAADRGNRVQPNAADPCALLFGGDDDEYFLLYLASWQRGYVHFIGNALDYLPRKNADDCLAELRWLYDRRDANEFTHITCHFLHCVA
jgi:hypothetical protein